MLKPIKAKDLIPELAKELNYDENLVRDVIDFYWRHVRKEVSSIKHCRVHLTNLGDFVVKHWRLKERIERLEQFEEFNRQKGLQQVTARFKNAETLYDLKKLNRLLEDEQQRKQFIKLHKSNFNESKGQLDNDMEE